MASFNNWNFFNRNVQSGLTEGQFLNSGSVLLCAGPPALGVGGGADLVQNSTGIGDVVFPLGLISGWGVSQQQPVIPIPEAGSYKRYTVTGPSDGSISLGRTLYHGPSLLRVLYAYFRAPLTSANRIEINPLIDNQASNLLRNPHNMISDTPGYENLWLNLASSIFSQPIGILLYIQDVNRESYGAIYLEQVMIGSHSIQSGPGQMVVNEQAQGSFVRVRPVKLAQPIPLMSRISNQDSNNDSGVITTAGSDRTTGSPAQQRLRVPTSANV